jgi:hypothetical protein
VTAQLTVSGHPGAIRKLADLNLLAIRLDGSDVLLAPTMMSEWNQMRKSWRSQCNCPEAFCFGPSSGSRSARRSTGLCLWP